MKPQMKKKFAGLCTAVKIGITEGTTAYVV